MRRFCCPLRFFPHFSRPEALCRHFLGFLLPWPNATKDFIIENSRTFGHSSIAVGLFRLVLSPLYNEWIFRGPFESPRKPKNSPTPPICRSPPESSPNLFSRCAVTKLLSFWRLSTLHSLWLFYVPTAPKKEQTTPHLPLPFPLRRLCCPFPFFFFQKG